MEKTNTRNILIAVIVIIVLGAIGYLFYPTHNDESAARATVTAFGQHLKNVSLLSPNASSTIAQEYGSFVMPALLAVWQSDPTQAPGRQTSSPWPDRIEVLSMTPQAKSYVVQGAIILMTSEETTHGGNAGIIPVMLQVVPAGDGKWYIAAYEEQATTSTSTSTAH